MNQSSAVRTKFKGLGRRDVLRQSIAESVRLSELEMKAVTPNPRQPETYRGKWADFDVETDGRMTYHVGANRPFTVLSQFAEQNGIDIIDNSRHDKPEFKGKRKQQRKEKQEHHVPATVFDNPIGKKDTTIAAQFGL